MNHKERYYLNEKYANDDLPDHIVEDHEEDHEETQEGGWKGRGSRTPPGKRQVDYFGYDARKSRIGKERVRGIYQKETPASWTGERVSRSPDKKGVSINAYRTYRAYVDGQELRGEHARGGSGDAPVRYFHGSPLAAARKVIGSLHKRGEIEPNTPVHIKLIEVTKGYRPAKGGYFEYEYYGMRDSSFKGTMIRGGQEIAVTGLNFAVPTRGKKNFIDALQASVMKGTRIHKKKMNVKM